MSELLPNEKRNAYPTQLLCGMRTNPIAVNGGKLRFSWRIEGDLQRQSAYQLLVCDSITDLAEDRGTVWDSGKVDGGVMAHVPYGGSPLASQSYYYWKVRVWDEADVVTDYSEPAVFATGIDGAWKADWIWTAEIAENCHVYLRKEIMLADKPVQSILAYVSADDMYKLYVNGAFVGQGPCPSYPDIEHNYNGYELLPFYEPGRSLCIAAHAYYQGLTNYVLVSGDGRAGFIAQIRIVYEDGTDEIVGTDQSWKTMKSEASSWTRKFGYDTGFNEQIDARAEPVGWRLAGFSDEAWEPAVLQDSRRWKLYAQETETVHVEERQPARIEKLDDGLRFDMEKEIVGTVRVTVEGRAGERLEIRLGEELNDNGSVRFDMRCNCVYQDVWTLRDGVQTIELYDYRAFRYGEVLAVSGSPQLLSVKVVARHYPFDDAAAHFTSSDDDLNALWDISKYSTKVGTQELYMDCPSREKANYSLDTFLEMSAAYYVAGEWNLSRKMIDYFLQSDHDGKLRCVAPAGRPHHFTEYTMYPVLMAWRYYAFTGDRPFLEEQYDAMCRVYRYMSAFADETGLLTGTNEALRDLVDWPVNMRDGHDMLPVNIVPNAVYYGMTVALASIAEALGKREDADSFAGKAAAFYRTFDDRFWREEAGVYGDGLDADGRLSAHASLHSGTFALAMGLVPEDRIASVMQHVRSRGLRCNLFLAMFLFEALFDCGEDDYALELLKAEGEFSPMNMIRKGATTTWEAWDLAHKANASLCHPAGAFPAYLIGSRVMGVMPAEPGFAKVRIRPQLGTLRSASIRVPTPRGAIHLSIRRQESGECVLEFRIPANMVADVYVPLKISGNGAGSPSVLVNGEKIQGERVGGYMLLRNLPCGQYKVEAR